MSKVRYIGLDVHKDSIAIAMADEGREPAQSYKTIPNDATKLMKELKSLARKASRLVVCYEAGPTGYGLYRRLRDAKIECQVVAPSLVPAKAGLHVKTDRRDAKTLAHFLRSGDLTPIYVPDEAAEALRDLERAREDAKRAERTAQQQLGKFLLRHDRRWDGGKTKWTERHMRWIRAQKFEHLPQQRVLSDYVKTFEDARERVRQLEKDIEEAVKTSALAPLITALQAFRGIALVSATVIAAELVDLRRFSTASELMSYLGLVPSEDSSGQRRRQGRITRAGNGNLRRILIEAAWHYRHFPYISAVLRRRNEPVAPGVQAIAWRAQKRLNRRYYRLIQRGKEKNKAITACARELAGFIWAVGQESQLLAT